MNRKQPDINFVNLHSHTTFSTFDGLGYPEDHVEYIWKNGCDAYTVTDHGHMNALPYQIEAVKKYRKEGKDIKPIYGVEAYVIPSLEDWRELYEAKKSGKKGEINATIVEDEDTKKDIKNKLKERRHMVLLAQNQQGLENLFKLISNSYKDENFYYFPRIDYDMLEEYNEGIISTSSCLGGIFAGDYWDHRDEGDQAVRQAMSQTAERMKDIFGDRFYAEVQWNAIQEQHELNKFVIETAEKHDLELVSNADAHYYSPDKWQARELYKQLGWLGKDSPETMRDNVPDTKDELSCELYPKNGDQMFADYKRYSEEMGFKYDDELIKESIEKTYHIAHNRIEDFYPENSVKLPDFANPDDGITPAEKLRELAEDGLVDRKGGAIEWSKEYLQRLDTELEVIEERGFSKYFLTCKKIVDEGKKHMLFGPSRGSAGGSLVSYLLGITEVDPIEHGLLFSRFLRKDAEGYPDIDLDVSDRDELRERLIDKWGEDSVAAVSNFNTLKLRSLIKDISKYLGIPFKEVNDVTSNMMDEATPKAKKANDIKAGFYTPTYEEVKKFSPSLQNFLKKYPEIEEYVDDLYGQVRNVSKHAGGLIITENLDQKMPLINSKGTTQTPWSEGARRRDLEPLGFIKYDLLGLKTLRVFESCIEKILKREGKQPIFENVKEFFHDKLHPDELDFNDQEIYENVFHDGKWVGIFQFTQEGAQNLCQRVKPRSLTELAAVTSIFRPGPLNAGVDEDYLKAKNNPDEITYEHEKMKEITEDTYGFLLFQEQIAQAAHKLGNNISLDEGNLLRKIITKKGLPEDKKKKKESLHSRFIEGCVEKGLSEKEARDLWNKFEYFSGYGFNKSHAIGYMIVAYQCAWLLTKYPAQWTAAFLDNEPEKKKEKAISIAKEAGYDIGLPNINESSDKWEVAKDGDKLLQPLTDIKGLGDAGFSQIMEHRPFNSIEELIFKEEIDYRPLNKRVIGRLIRTTACDDLMDDRFQNRKHMWLAVASDKPSSEKKLKENIETYSTSQGFTDIEFIDTITDLTGVYPLHSVISNKARKRLNELAVPPMGMMDPNPMDGAENLCWFIIKDKKLRKARNGNKYWVITVTDTTNETNHIKIWNASENDPIVRHQAYMANLDYDPNWGFSMGGLAGNIKMIDKGD